MFILNKKTEIIRSATMRMRSMYAVRMRIIIQWQQPGRSLKGKRQISLRRASKRVRRGKIPKSPKKPLLRQLRRPRRAKKRSRQQEPVTEKKQEPERRSRREQEKRKPAREERIL